MEALEMAREGWGVDRMSGIPVVRIAQAYVMGTMKTDVYQYMCTDVDIDVPLSPVIRTNVIEFVCKISLTIAK
jgi:hypothetical protein